MIKFVIKNKIMFDFIYYSSLYPFIVMMVSIIAKGCFSGKVWQGLIIIFALVVTSTWRSNHKEKEMKKLMEEVK